MRKPRCILVILLLSVFGVSLAVPAEDLPETAYDESETLPYEGTPQFLIVAPQASARMAKAELSFGFLDSLGRLNKRSRQAENITGLLVASDSLTIRNHSFRC